MDLSLPTSLADWSAAANEIDHQGTRLLSIGDILPQGRLNTKPPIIDFSKLELGGYIGMVAYSAAFKAKPDWILGLSGRLPVPSIPLGGWGAWGEIWLSHIKRDLAFFYPHKSGTWYGGALGGDFEIYKDEYIFVRPRAGLMYADWNRTRFLDNGIGGIVGLQFGILWIRHTQQAALVFTPELSYDGKNWIGFLNFGFQIDF